MFRGLFSGSCWRFLGFKFWRNQIVFFNIFMCDPHSTMNLYFQRLLGDISGLLQRKKQPAGQQNSQKLIGSQRYYSFPYYPWDERYIYLHLVDFYGINVGKYTKLVPWIRHGIRNRFFLTFSNVTFHGHRSDP